MSSIRCQIDAALRMHLSNSVWHPNTLRHSGRSFEGFDPKKAPFYRIRNMFGKYVSVFCWFLIFDMFDFLLSLLVLFFSVFFGF